MQKLKKPLKRFFIWKSVRIYESPCITHGNFWRRRPVNSKIGSRLSQETWRDNRKTARITMYFSQFVQFSRERLALSGHVDREARTRRVDAGGSPHEGFSRNTLRFDCISLRRYSRRRCVDATADSPSFFRSNEQARRESLRRVLTPMYYAVTRRNKCPYRRVSLATR